MTAFVPQQYLNASIGMGAAFHELAIVLEDMEQLPVVQQELRHLFPETSVRAWYELEPALQVMMESSGLFSYIFFSLDYDWISI
ncbi:hypothetical protein A3SI_17414 [Nitritalea halalkaliphila LW7]|uniref:Uncharacterized protein n=1 Tax=Nitritalea halalkaliphila LW7 TaxID=1189621 RepID=I5BVU6_9BACT|nr:hypothetical protein [Nitritalea halalkaliphila]EIM73698.1 hypothetical protein A3SI_17414 [Nitritalea halalkaliphila LW7]